MCQRMVQPTISWNLSHRPSIKTSPHRHAHWPTEKSLVEIPFDIYLRFRGNSSFGQVYNKIYPSQSVIALALVGLQPPEPM